MSFKFTKLEKKTFSKESSDFDELDLDNENVDDEKINKINNYQINNNLSSQLASMNNIKISEEEKIKEKEPQKNQEEKINNTQFYELTTNNLVEKIKNEYDEIYLNQRNDINKFVEKLANENSELKLEISKLKSEIMKYKIKNEFNYNNNYNLNKVDKNKENEINLEQFEEENKKINDEYNYIIQNISSNIIIKNIKLKEENEKLNLENNKIKFEFIQEKNKIIEKIIEIQSKVNSDIELNKNIFLNQNEENKLNNVYLYYIDKIKNLTYEKNKLLTCNYDFFIKINDLSQLIEEKNNIINEKQQIISSNELKILNLEQEINIIKIKNKEISNQLKEAQIKINEFSFDKGDNIVFQEKILDNKYNMMKRQLENKIAQLNKNLEDLNIKNINISKNNKELKETNEKLVTDFLLKKEQLDNIMKEKNKLIKDINNLKTDIKIKEEEIITNKNEYENKIKYLEENINNVNDNKKDDIDQIKSLINSIYEKLPINNENNINSNIALFLKNNINEIAKLKEINKQMYSLYKNKEMNIILKEENEKLKNHIKEIMNLTLEKANITYIEKFKEEFINISLEQLILKIINFIKVYKICFLLQKIKTILNYSEKYINWLNEKEFFKNNNTSFDDVQLELKKIEEEINNIKIILKNNSLDFEKKIKNYLSKDEIKVEINNIQKKYEKIITDIIEYFLKHKINNYKEDKEILSLQIPIKNYNLMIENNMNNLSLINQSIDSWSFFVNNDLNENNDNVFQAIINMTNLNNNIELNNINDFVVNNNNNTENNMNENKYISSYEKEENENDENESNERNDTENKEKENESQYSIENKE